MRELTQACDAYFGLSQPPFGLTPNTDFYVDLPAQQQAFEVLMFALGSGEGFIKITGEVGTGKTLLCRRLLNHLRSRNEHSLYIANPALSADGLWLAVARELQLFTGGRSAGEVQADIQQALLQLAAQGQRVVLIIDEAQSMPPATLEALRLISNLETEQQKLVQIVLFGQPELNEILALPSFRQLRQRITYSSELQPLSSPEVLAVYLQQRLAVAGYRGLPLFEAAAVQALWQASGGVPRLVNILAAKTLLAAFGNGSRQLQRRHVLAAVADTDSANAVPASYPGIRTGALLGAALLVLL